MNRKLYFRVSLIVLTFSLLFALIFSCAAKKAFWGDEKSGYILMYRFPAGESVTYQTKTSQTINQEAMGQSMEFNTNMFNLTTFTGDRQDEQHNIVTTASFDSFSVVVKGMGTERKIDMSAVVGKQFRLTISPQGRKIGFYDPDSIQIDFGRMVGKRRAESFFRNPFPILPTDRVKIGDTWSDSEQMSMPQGGMDVNIKTSSVSTLQGIETVDGIECMKITTTLTGTLKGEGTQMGMDMVFEGDLEGNSTWYFDFKKGRFIKLDAENMMEGTVEVTGAQTMTIPITQETRVSTRLMK